MRIVPNPLTLVLALAVCTAPLAAQALQASKVVRVGVFAGGGPAFQTGFEPFRQRLRQLG
jgi:hypothetical protein